MWKTATLLMALMVALASVGSTQAHQSRLPDISDSSSTAGINIEFLSCSCSDPPGTPDAGSDTDIGWSNCELVDADEDGHAELVQITVNRAYPSYQCAFNMTLRNGGTIPVRIAEARLVHDYRGAVLDLEELWEDGTLVGAQLHPDETATASFWIRINEVATPGASYTFQLQISAVQWDDTEDPGEDADGTPSVMCKWEQDDTEHLEDGDPSHTTPGAQFLPPLEFGMTKVIQHWAIGSAGLDNEAQVVVDVFYPVGPPRFGVLMQQVMLEKVDTTATGAMAYHTAQDAGLVSYKDGHPDATITDALEEGTAEVYMAEASMLYCQPAGCYRTVTDFSFETGAPTVEIGPGLSYYFTYIAVAGFDIDFDRVDYGTVEACTDTWISGDEVFDEPLGQAPYPNPATVRNIGNTDISITAVQDDMGFGSSGSDEREAWNVSFEARLGIDPSEEVLYYPFEEAILPGKLPICSASRLDFSIHLKEPATGSYSGRMTLGCLMLPFGDL